MKNNIIQVVAICDDQRPQHPEATPRSELDLRRRRTRTLPWVFDASFHRLYHERLWEVHGNTISNFPNPWKPRNTTHEEHYWRYNSQHGGFPFLCETNHVLSRKDWSILCEHMSRTWQRLEKSTGSNYHMLSDTWKVTTEDWRWDHQRNGEYLPMPTLTTHQIGTTERVSLAALSWLVAVWLHRNQRDRAASHYIEHRGRTCGNERMCDRDQVCCIPQN